MVSFSFIKIKKLYFILFVEMHQDLSEYHAEKMKRVERKLDNLRKSALGYYLSSFFFV